MAIKRVVDAENEYHLANHGTWDTDISQLDTGYPVVDGAVGSKDFSLTVTNDDYSIHLVQAVFRKAPYANAGFAYSRLNRTTGLCGCLLCIEQGNIAEGSFCKDIFGATYLRSGHGQKYFRLPGESCRNQQTRC